MVKVAMTMVSTAYPTLAFAQIKDLDIVRGRLSINRQLTV
jgi:hypothetical protein